MLLFHDKSERALYLLNKGIKLLKCWEILASTENRTKEQTKECKRLYYRISYIIIKLEEFYRENEKNPDEEWLLHIIKQFVCSIPWPW